MLSYTGYTTLRLVPVSKTGMCWEKNVLVAVFQPRYESGFTSAGICGDSAVGEILCADARLLPLPPLQPAREGKGHNGGRERERDRAAKLTRWCHT